VTRRGACIDAGAMATVELDDDEVRLLREVLEAHLRQLLNESAHADARAYRAMLRRRQAAVASLQARLPAAG
jgi:prophage DNA circulation protein